MNLSCSITNSYAAIVADVNTDNLVDLIFYCDSNWTLNIFVWNNYNDTFEQLISYPFERNESVSHILVGDMNNDNHIDLILVGNIDGQSYLNILFGNGDGKFQIENIESIAIISDPSYITVANLNNDRNLDVIIAIALDGIYIFFGNGNGTFSFPLRLNIEYESDLRGLVIDDFNNDNQLDIAILTATDLCMHIYFGKNNGSSWLEKWFFISLNIKNFIPISADFDGNNQSDIVILTVSTDISSVLYRYNNGTFYRNEQTFMDYFWAFGAIATGDLNNDHHIDIVTTMINSQDIFFFLGNRNGNFQVYNLTSSEFMDVWIWNSIIDLNNDNCQDIININNVVGNIDIFLNTCQC